VPDAYSPVYPVGALVSGEVGRMDYKVAAVSLPLTHRDYVPRPGSVLRPVVGVGYTPFVGLRLGVTATDGPYLNSDFTTAQTASESWRAYHQKLGAADLEYGVGHLDVRAEYAYATYRVPNNGVIAGQAGYL